MPRPYKKRPPSLKIFGAMRVPPIRKQQDMKFDPEKHHRRSIRLQDYDYAQEGAYFVTICTQNRECLFGDIVDGQIRLNDVGEMVEKWWFEIIKKFPEVEVDEFVIMPNHFHGIIVLVGADLCVCPDGVKGGPIGPPLQKHAADGQAKRSALSRIVQWFKTMATNEYLRNIKKKSWAPISNRLWQRNCFEPVIRSEKSLNKIREYITVNPAQWETDPENPLIQASSIPLEKSLFL